MIRIFLILLFGLLPAVLLMVPAFAVIIAGVVLLLELKPLGLLLVTWALFGVQGLFSLVSATFEMKAKRTQVGLLAGIVAATPVVVIPIMSGAGDEYFWLFLIASSPIVVASYLIYELQHRR